MIVNRKILEIACFNLESALIAQSFGVDRIELCTNYNAGGLSPDNEVIREARSKAHIPIHVMIRPIPGDYFYAEQEIREMKKTIAYCKDNRIEGIVFGALTPEFEVDREVCAGLISYAKPLSCTFHRAVDHCRNIDEAIEVLIELGFNRVLTSGAHDNAVKGAAELKRLQSAYGEKITIMAGGGIRSSNIKNLLKTGCNEFHSAAITSNLEMADPTEIRALRKLI